MLMLKQTTLHFFIAGRRSWGCPYNLGIIKILHSQNIQSPLRLCFNERCCHSNTIKDIRVYNIDILSFEIIKILAKLFKKDISMYETKAHILLIRDTEWPAVSLSCQWTKKFQKLWKMRPWLYYVITSDDGATTGHAEKWK